MVGTPLIFTLGTKLTNYRIKAIYFNMNSWEIAGFYIKLLFQDNLHPKSSLFAFILQKKVTYLCEAAKCK